MVSIGRCSWRTYTTSRRSLEQSASSQDITWNANNDHRQSSSREVGTQVSGGGGFDAAGQLVMNGSIRPEQSLVAGMTGAVAAGTLVRTPSPRLIYAVPATGAGAGATNTLFNNAYYGESTNVWEAGGLGGVFGVLGPIAGVTAQRATAPIFTSAPRLSNVPGYVGAAVNNTVSNLPSFIPLDNGKPKQQHGSKP